VFALLKSASAVGGDKANARGWEEVSEGGPLGCRMGAAELIFASLEMVDAVCSLVVTLLEVSI
jgi:hypothetical protein